MTIIVGFNISPSSKVSDLRLAARLPRHEPARENALSWKHWDVFMHELSIAMNIVEGVLEEAQRHGTTRVQAVHLRLGPLSGVDKEALLFAYPMACEGTILENSRLQIIETGGNELEITAFELADEEDR
jgi:hypothetical protein